MAEYRIEFDGYPSNVTHARSTIVAFARSWFSGLDLADIELAAGEALANSVEHGGVGGRIEMHCTCNGFEFTLELKDSGRGFDLDGVRQRTSVDETTRGFGISIIRSLVDRLEYSERGTRLRITKRVPIVDAEGQVELRA